jgi:hypothetical protein
MEMGEGLAFSSNRCSALMELAMLAERLALLTQRSYAMTGASSTLTIKTYSTMEKN